MIRCSRIIIRLFFNPAGYTLLELITVLALLGVLLALTIPHMAVLSHWQLEAGSRRLAADLRLLRQEAIISGEQCKAEFYVYEQRYYLCLPEGRNRVDLPEGVRFSGTTTFSGSPPAALFDPFGWCNGGTVILKSGDSLRYIIVTPVTGRVRISSSPPPE